MPHNDRFALARLAGGATLAMMLGTGAEAADLPFLPSPPPAVYGVPSQTGGGGYHVATVPLRPRPLRYDIYGYPLIAAVPSPLAVGNGCPAAIQPDYDPDGNFAGYAPIPMCR